MTRLDISGDARRVLDVVKAGGVCVFPTDVGYAGVGGCEAALMRFFRAKGRGAHKRNAMLGSLAIHDEVHDMPARGREMIRALVLDYDLPISAIGPFRADHPLPRALEPGALAASTENGTLAILMNVGALEEEMARLALAETQPLFGSSANLTGTGTKFRAEDVQAPIRDCAELVIDYGLRKYHPYRRSSTMIDFTTLEVVRIGACYELIQDVLRRHFSVELPPDPGLEALPSGHTRAGQQVHA
jgi:tRNA A37 threonylcarbamoyladenosine synthetase subunit TsaC/SUA5/YrdC